MRVRATLVGAAFAVAALLFVLARTQAPHSGTADLERLGTPRSVAPGVSLYHVTDAALLDPPAPVSIWILRADLALVDLRPALAHDRIMTTETVAAIADRHGAVAAVNAGFFLPNGDPLGLYKIGGQLVSETRRPRGAVGIIRTRPSPRLIFGRVEAAMTLHVGRGDGPGAAMAIAGIDTTRLLGRLMLFTPLYHQHTDTAPGGLEWIVDGDPLRVRAQPRSGGKTPIPAGGFVLSFGGRSPPAPLTSLAPGTPVELETRYTPANGREEDWSAARDIIGGAGLLARDGRFVDSWEAESFAAGFAENRHPRTMIGNGPDGTVWLVAVDGRQPQLSAGMTLVELRELARSLELTNALNLDGGGSTTMWVKGQVVNSPSDAGGPREVGDALLVMRR